MADYPINIKNFLQLQDGIDTVLAAHPNDRGDEITALETLLGNFGDVNNQTYLTSLTEYMIDDRIGTRVFTGTTTDFQVSKGSIAINNGSGDIRWRRNGSNETFDFDNLDTGVATASTMYNIYVTADFAGQTFSTVLSLDDTNPSGSSYYRKIGYLNTDANADVLNVGTIDDEATEGFARSSLKEDFVISDDLSFVKIQNMDIGLQIVNENVHEIIFNPYLVVSSGGSADSNMALDITLNGTTISTSIIRFELGPPLGTPVPLVPIKIYKEIPVGRNNISVYLKQDLANEADFTFKGTDTDTTLTVRSI